MRAYGLFALKRFGQLLVVVFLGVSATFFITHLSPIDPVEQTMRRLTSRTGFSPEAQEEMRAALTELYGTDKPLLGQFVSFWSRLVRGDMGPSLLAFPTPALKLVRRALPWTVGLLTTTVIITWTVGNLLGGLAGYFQDNRFLKAFGVLAIGVQPIPYYIVAFIMLILFGFVWPVLPRTPAQPVRPAGRLPLPPALPARHRQVPDRGAAPGDGRRRPPLGVLAQCRGGAAHAGKPQGEGGGGMSAILEVANVSKRFAMGGVLSRRHVEAVTDASFAIEEGQPEVFTIVGESGSGKTTLARMMLGLELPTAGEIRLSGRSMADRRGRTARIEFMRHAQPVFQNPFEAFNPLKRVDRYLDASARVLLGARGREGIDAAMDEAVGLSLAEVRGRYAHELSGGQLQRVAIARALIPNPEILIADEPVSMVDAWLRMSIVNLLRDLRDTLNVTVIYITHDLATAYYISDRIIIMQQGYIVEMGPAQAVLESPEHPYARLLKESVLSVDDPGRGRVQAPDRSLALAAAETSGSGTLVQRAGGRSVRMVAE